jgi:hypothetical protein
MTGTDVSSWLQFLVSQGFLSAPANGTFDAAADQATRDYQTARGLGSDGFAGPSTLSQAVRDGFTGPDGLLSPGMDAAVNCTSFADAIVASGMKFVARYYTRFSNKVISRTEALTLSQAGLQLVTVFQDVNNNIQFFNATLGAQNAGKALQLAAAIGQPSGSAIYFAADFNPSSAQVTGPIMDHFRAIAAAFSANATQYAVGVYGSGMLCRMLRDAGLAQFTWLTGSTSFPEYASFLPQANLVQIAPSRTLIPDSLDIDDDIAQTSAFGAFQVS